MVEEDACQRRSASYLDLTQKKKYVSVINIDIDILFVIEMVIVIGSVIDIDMLFVIEMGIVIGI